MGGILPHIPIILREQIYTKQTRKRETKCLCFTAFPFLIHFINNRLFSLPSNIQHSSTHIRMQIYFLSLLSLFFFIFNDCRQKLLRKKVQTNKNNFSNMKRYVKIFPDGGNELKFYYGSRECDRIELENKRAELEL